MTPATDPAEVERGAARPPYRLVAAEVVVALGGDAARGLREDEARRRLSEHGPNALPAAPPVPAWRRLAAQFRDVLTALLLFATAVSAVVWWLERETPAPYEALTILAIVLLNGLLGFFQERRAEQALSALEAMSAPTARVVRDGERRTVPSAEVVPGDLLVLEEGDTVPADARVLEAVALRAAEAALTGESAPVVKSSAPVPGDAAIGDRTSMVFAGTAIAAGHGKALVTATGAGTEVGGIARSLQTAQRAPTPLQRELDRVGKVLGLAVVAIAAAVGATLVAIQGLSAPRDLVEVLLLSVSLAVAAVPEGLTAITTIVLSLGTQRLARRNVIVRRLSSVETLGATTAICSDKTGTLTRNELTVRTVLTASGAVELTGVGYDPAGALRAPGGGPIENPALLGEVREALAAAHLASNAVLVRRDGRFAVQGDPTEGALVVASAKAGHAGEELERRFPRAGEVPFSSERKLMSTAHVPATGEVPVLLVKGAPDVLLARCTEERVAGASRALGPARRAELLRDVERLAASGLRTLGVASRRLPRDAVLGELSAEVEEGLCLLGIVGMIDPPRPEAGAAVAEARRAGVRPILITGDHPVTAAAVAAELGIAAPGDRALTGTELDRMDEPALRAAVREVNVYARVAPEHKLRIVRALRANGEIAAMTGDGVNDAPALDAADIGVAMGIAGTDVAKGAADMILTDDDFASIVAAVAEGRSIFANIQRFLRFLLSSNLGEVLVMFLGVVLAPALGLVAGEGSTLAVPLLATQILWINLLTDSAPALALGVEPADRRLMLRPPRDRRGGVLGRRTWGALVYAGVVMAASTLAVMDWALAGGLVGSGGAGGLLRARTMGFTTLVLAQLFNAFNSRFEHRSAAHRPFANGWLWIAVGCSAALQVAVVHVPALQRGFSTVPLSGRDWLVCTVAASAVLWAMELWKLGARARGQRTATVTPRA